MVGDDVCEEDPTVNRLQTMAAEKLGMEAALFVPSGTFGNQCAIGLHACHGDEVILSETCHVVEHEAGAASALWGAQLRTVRPGRTPFLTVEDILPRLRHGNDVHEPCTGLIILENALADGTVMPIREMERIKATAREHGIKVHLDGARIFNAALTLNVNVRNIAAHVDSVTFCLSKGLGAPVGSLLVGDSDFIRRARRRRKMMGGGMRQVGVLAAPGILALTQGIDRLREDHENAALLGKLLSGIPGVVVDTKAVQTNMVFCRIDRKNRSETGLVAFLAEKGFKNYPPTGWGLRFVTSSQVNEEDVRALAKAAKDYLE